MNLSKELWTEKDGRDFIKYLESLKNEARVEWTKNILNTNMPVLAIKTPQIKNIVKELMTGNYLSFLDLQLNQYYENSAINGIIISQIKDFSIMKKYLDNYVLGIDNWALCDLLSFEIKNHKEDYYDIVLEYIKNDKPFIRRVGFVILFHFVKDDSYTNKIFTIMNSFYNEHDYYVNMINAWLFCEMFIKKREETITFLKKHNLNKFTINKGISKCRDSYRVSKEDKDMLLEYKVK